jgi:hypothetical protein
MNRSCLSQTLVVDCSWRMQEQSLRILKPVSTRQRQKRNEKPSHIPIAVCACWRGPRSLPGFRNVAFFFSRRAIRLVAGCKSPPKSPRRHSRLERHGRPGCFGDLRTAKSTCLGQILALASRGWTAPARTAYLSRQVAHSGWPSTGTPSRPPAVANSIPAFHYGNPR